MSPSPVVACLACFLLYFVGYRYYSRWLARRVFSLDDARPTPAVVEHDGVDYVPTRRFVLFGHHFASITGLSPMLGPAVAVIWGWLPAMLWVVVGALVVGCVHDFAALVLSARARGRSIGVVAAGILGPRARSLFHAVIFFGVALAMGVFVIAIAQLFGADKFPEAALPSGGLMIVAAAVGILLRRGMRLLPLTVAGFLIQLALIGLGMRFGKDLAAAAWPGDLGWKAILLGYAFLASVLPVWSLLQPRDFLNSLLLYLGLLLAFAGLFVANPSFEAPALNLEPAGAPPFLPFVFIVIACGAVSGFHALVSSGTTAKQLVRESDARPIGYGGMIGESLLGLLAVLACTAAAQPASAWTDPHGHYGSWQAIETPGRALQHFIEGAASLVERLGVPLPFAVALISVVVVSFALTTLDSATRLLRFNVEEIASALRVPFVGRHGAAAIAVAAIGFFAFSQRGQTLWVLFGTVNQMLAALTLLVVALYLRQRRRPWLIAGIPCAFMLASTMVAMIANLRGHWRDGRPLLVLVGAALFAIALWVVVEALLALHRAARTPAETSLEISISDPKS